MTGTAMRRPASSSSAETPLQAEVDAEGLVELGHERRAQLAYPVADALDGNGPDLLSLRLGVPPQPGDPGRQENLKRVDPLGAGGDRHDRDHPATTGEFCVFV
jgi:hypothetical protein